MPARGRRGGGAPEPAVQATRLLDRAPAGRRPAVSRPDPPHPLQPRLCRPHPPQGQGVRGRARGDRGSGPVGSRAGKVAGGKRQATHKQDNARPATQFHPIRAADRQVPRPRRGPADAIAYEEGRPAPSLLRFGPALVRWGRWRWLAVAGAPLRGGDCGPGCGSPRTGRRAPRIAVTTGCRGSRRRGRT